MSLPTPEDIAILDDFTLENPLRLLVSGCLTGLPCGVDGSSYGEHPMIRKLLAFSNVMAIPFCPEDFALGTPRSMPDIHGGNGFDVLDGKAKVLDENHKDLTDRILEASYRMLHLAQKHNVHFAILMDMSAACGSQVISDGCRLTAHRSYQKGPGVAAALLMRHHFKVISQRDFRTLEHLFMKVDKNHIFNESAHDHHETEWYREYFKIPQLQR